MLFSEANYRSRVRRIQAEMAKSSIDALVLERPESSFYVTGYNAIIYSRPVYAVLTQNGDPILVLPYLREAHAKDESPWVKDIRTYFEFSVLGRTFYKDALSSLKAALDDRSVLGKTVGIEMDHVSASSYARFQRSFPNANFVNASTLIDSVKSIKDPDEIEVIRAACKISNAAMERSSEVIKRRGTERDLFLEATLAIIDEWKREYSNFYFSGLHHETHAFHASVSSGPQHQLHYGSHKPTDRRIQDGDGVTVIFTPSLCCYHGELERTFLVGKLNDIHVKMFKAVLEARERAFGLIKPGTRCSQIDEAARTVFKEHGLADYIRHRSGHSIGIELHEHPLLGEGDSTTIEQNMVFAVEPGLYRDDVGGVRHSDTVLVTSQGCEFLTEYDRGYLTR